MKRLAAIAILLFFASCTHPKGEKKLNKLQWLIGDWKMESEAGYLLETWRRESDIMFTGKGIMVTKDNDTNFNEGLTLIVRNDLLYYVVRIPANSNEAITFQETSVTDNKVIFENPQHDFPKRIIYVRKDENHIVAKITGSETDTTMVQEFPLTRE